MSEELVADDEVINGENDPEQTENFEENEDIFEDEETELTQYQLEVLKKNWQLSGEEEVVN